MPNIDDPFKPSDATILRPRPGAGRRPGGGSGGGGGEPPAYRPPGQYDPHSDPSPAPPSREGLGVGLNPLVQAATPLLLLAGQLRGTLSAPDVGGLRRHVLDEIRRFEERARNAGVANEVVLAARYALCAGLDEAVLSTPWGAQSEWAQQTLLVALHREAWGGEKFFDMLDRISNDPSRHIDLIELQYLCIALGFAGKHQVAQRGHARLAEVQHDVFRRIRTQRGQSPPELSLKWRGLQDRRNPLIRYVPWWVAGAAALALLVITFVIYQTRLSSAAAPVQAVLADVGTDIPMPAATGPITGPTLKQLLAPEEARGALSVEENQGRTLITLPAADLFASGSVSINSAYNDTLRKIAAALDRVPGRVLVIGHTDDQPLRSFRYRDNFELSRERAVSVVNLLKTSMTTRDRLDVSGAGSSKPRYRPESEPPNRARNRRVEILHVRGA
jgi:type VI secretion system protein ImpK